MILLLTVCILLAVSLMAQQPAVRFKFQQVDSNHIVNYQPKIR
jgi:hypothetical protein